MAMIPIWIGKEWIPVMTRLIPGELKMLVGSLFMKCAKMRINAGTWQIQFKNGENPKMEMDNNGHYIPPTPDEGRKIPAKTTEVKENIYIFKMITN